MHDAILASLAAGETKPHPRLPVALQALWWAKRGGLATGPDWDRAHELAQQGEGDRDCDLVHALLHRIEGDSRNAAYWYRKAGIAPVEGTLEEVWSASVRRIAAK